LGHGKFVSTFRAFGHCTIDCGRAAGTRESSAICDVESEAAFRALHHMFRLRTHSISPSLNQRLREILKTFLKGLINPVYAEILTTLKTIKYSI
jgi:hypothetical protein